MTVETYAQSQTQAIANPIAAIEVSHEPLYRNARCTEVTKDFKRGLLSAAPSTNRPPKNETSAMPQ